MAFCIATAIFAQDRKVALFDPIGSVPQSTKEIVREEISSVVVNTKGYVVLERTLIDKVLEENKFQEGGLVDDNEISDLGRMMGANYVLVSSLTTMENDSYYLSFKMIDVKTARIEKQKTARCEIKDLIDVVEKTVNEMFGTPITNSTSKTAGDKTESALSKLPTEDKCAILHIYRTVGSNHNPLALFIDDINICTINAKNIHTIKVREGDIVLFAKITTSLGTEMGLPITQLFINDIKCGQEYYIRCEVPVNLVKGANLRVVDMNDVKIKKEFEILKRVNK